MLDAYLRGGAIAATALLALVVLAETRSRRAVSLAVFSVCIIAYLGISAPGADALPRALRYLLFLGAVAAPLPFAALVVDLLTDPPFDRRPWLAMGALVALTGLAAALVPALAPLRGALALALYLALGWLAIRTDGDDLVPARRRFRRMLLAAMAILGVVITGVEIANPAELPALLLPLQALGFLALGLAASVWCLRGAADLFAPATGPAAPKSQAASPALIEALRKAMEEDEVWREENLSIGALAARLAVPEHRLRSTINKALGHRNFSSFVNGYRIAAARAVLDDPQAQGRTVLEIAYECGFASLGPFNRAFRAQTGQSPTEYRSARP